MPIGTVDERAFELPRGLDDVPDNNFGIYAFRLSLPNDARLGFHANNPEAPILAEELLRRAERLSMAMCNVALAGNVATDQASHIRFSYSVAASPADDKTHSRYLAQLIAELGGDVEAVRTAASVLRYALELSLPLYIGMTANQTFRQRIGQHISGTTQFSERLRDLRISWSDLKVIVRPLDVPRKAVLSAEKMAQSLLRPRISLA